MRTFAEPRATFSLASTMDALQADTLARLDSLTLAQVRRRARGCEACPLYAHATQTVFGEGAKSARVVLVGEQPGDREDVAGRPFIGPAGQLLEAALEEAGIARNEAYVTNAVKHFKWKPAGKRRLHQKPTAREVAACRPWLEAELRLVRPSLVIALGGTAAQSLLGSQFRVLRDRGRPFAAPWGGTLFATVHPSAILRAPAATKAADRAAFVGDLRRAAKWLSTQRRPDVGPVNLPEERYPTRVATRA